ncbi:hypothetical protein J416_13931 [Gracilibacillus halophilus YIM-C55.5]|uniref:SnoaL-like domain-containing protein n=1 Tax=Gracilibacillus halophilus YIM-C55.5 TaxID=1308866 RepID=N4WI15_9BACI|nr:nuclear transport factor 2 family protein [Gracilibacillus halophilus]ENH95817.1 hypothetical protein J416_13931 [Gracilibacillus halophilus YIM-C55.5]
METNLQTFFRNFNEAIIKQDIDGILSRVTDNVTWRMVGNDTIRGIEQLRDVFGSQDQTDEFELEIEDMIINGKEAAVHGMIHKTDSNGKEKHYRFCDIYKLHQQNDGKIEEIISYVLAV